MESLFIRLGGADALDAAVDLFYAKVLDDANLAPFFDGLDMARQRKAQKAFLTTAFGGPRKYEGPKLGNVHQSAVKAGLDSTHFDAVLGHLGATLEELGVAPELIAEAAAIAESTRNEVLGIALVS